MPSLLPVLLPSGLDRERNTRQICDEPTLQRWWSWEHIVQGLAADAKVRPVTTRAKRHHQEKRQTREGDIYVAVKKLGFLDPTANGDIPFDVSWKAFQAAKPKGLKCSKDSYRRAINQRVSELNMAELVGGWSMSPEARAILGPDDETMRRLGAADMDAFKTQLDVMVTAYADFRDTFFETPRGERYITAAPRSMTSSGQSSCAATDARTRPALATRDSADLYQVPSRYRCDHSHSRPLCCCDVLPCHGVPSCSSLACSCTP